MTVTLDDLRAYEADTARAVPGFRLAWKDESRWQRAIGSVLRPFNPGYLTGYATTLHPVVWFPSRQRYEQDPHRSLVTLAHERVHLHDCARAPLGFRLAYLLPQLLALPLAGAAVAMWLTLGAWPASAAAALAVASLLPWPAPGRVRAERRGYAMTLAAAAWLGEDPRRRLDGVRSQFLGWGYYRMSWSRRATDEWLERVLRSIEDGTIAREEPYASTLAFLRARGLGLASTPT